MVSYSRSYTLYFDFKEDLEFFGDRILPLMKQADLRLGKESFVEE